MIVQISNPPDAQENPAASDPDKLSLGKLQNITSTLINAAQLGKLDALLNTTILEVDIIEPVAEPGSIAWQIVDSVESYDVRVSEDGTFHFCIYVKCNMYNNQPVRAYTDKSMYSSVISGRSE